MSAAVTYLPKKIFIMYVQGAGGTPDSTKNISSVDGHGGDARLNSTTWSKQHLLKAF